MPGCCDPIEMRVYKSISQTNQSAWQKLRKSNQILTDAAYLKAVEQSEVIDCEYRYFEFYDDKKLICSMAGYVFDQDLLDDIPKGIANVLFPIRKAFPPFLKVKTLIIGTPISIGQTLLIASSISADKITNLLTKLIDYGKNQHIELILMRDFRGEKDNLEQAIDQVGFECLSNYPLAVMPVPWHSFDAYLSAMKSRYRYDARRRFKQKDNHTIQTQILNDESALDDLKSYQLLYEKVLQQSNDYPHEFIKSDYHQAMWNNLGNRSYWLQYFHEEQMVAFIHFIQAGKRVIAQYIGLDYQVSESAQLYFNALYDLIRFAIEHNIEMIEAGVTTYQAKSSVGFSIIPQRMYLWHKRILIRKLAQWVAPGLSSKEKDKCHTIFKDKTLQSIPYEV